MAAATYVVMQLVFFWGAMATARLVVHARWGGRGVTAATQLSPGAVDDQAARRSTCGGYVASLGHVSRGDHVRRPRLAGLRCVGWRHEVREWWRLACAWIGAICGQLPPLVGLGRYARAAGHCAFDTNVGALVRGRAGRQLCCGALLAPVR